MELSGAAEDREENASQDADKPLQASRRRSIEMRGGVFEQRAKRRGTAKRARRTEERVSASGTCRLYHPKAGRPNQDPIVHPCDGLGLDKSNAHKRHAANPAGRHPNAAPMQCQSAGGQVFANSFVARATACTRRLPADNSAFG